MTKLKEIADLQESYRKLVRTKRLTKRAICDLVIPFRDKYNLTDKDALMIARNEITLSKIVDLMEDNKYEDFRND